VKKTDQALVALLIALTGCGAQAAATPADSMPVTAPHADAGTRPANPNVLNGVIVETMNSAGYTYVLLDTDSGKIWAAATETDVRVGQRVSVPAGQVMTGFTSKTLNRTFDEIHFVDGIYPEGSVDMAAGQGHDMAGASRTVVSDAHVEKVPKADGGYTVEEILARGSTLNGQNVKVRGRVVKFTAGIMGTNWLHIQDGSPGDLTVTTDTLVTKGDQVMVEGMLSVNKDFGAGYLYPVIIEKATVTKE
jgi:hypothetical protein